MEEEEEEVEEEEEEEEGEEEATCLCEEASGEVWADASSHESLQQRFPISSCFPVSLPHNSFLVGFHFSFCNLSVYIRL